jgi:hypothetical protein
MLLLAMFMHNFTISGERMGGVRSLYLTFDLFNDSAHSNIADT